MIVKMRGFGSRGFISDTPAHMLPVGSWSHARNVRFKGNYVERILEPEPIFPALPAGGIMWAEQFYDGQITRVVVATATDLYMSSPDATAWNTVTRASGAYNTPADGYWQSFPWGNTVVFNNGVDIPQVYDADAQIFIDLPNWGIITNPDGTENYDTGARARILAPFKNVLVAANVIEQIDAVEEEQPNTVWWSDTYPSPDLWKDFGNTWDYNVATNNAGKDMVGLEDGPIQWMARLGAAMMVYNTSSTTRMMFAGGPNVMDLDRILDYGCAGLYGATEFKNYHFVVGPDVMYVHDGNSLQQVAEDRVRDWFYRNVRNLESSVRLVTDYTQREVVVAFDAAPDEYVTNATDPIRLGLVYNYDDDTFSVIDASVDVNDALDPVKCMVYGLDLGQAGEVGDTWDSSTLPWDSYGETRWNELQGSAGSQAVKVSLFWVTADQVHRANKLSLPAPNKSYTIEKTNIDLDEIQPELNTAIWKHLKRMYPHAVGNGSFRARFGWSSNLVTPPLYRAWVDYGLLNSSEPTASHKMDLRTTGRYLAMQFDFRNVDAMRFTGADIDVVAVYGR